MGPKQEPVRAAMGQPAPPTVVADDAVDEALAEAETPTAAEPRIDLELLEASFAALRQEILQVLERKLEMDRFREEQVDRLHQELQVYRNDLLSRVTRPLFESLIRLHDDLGRSRQDLGERLAAGAPVERTLEVLAGFQEDVEIALERHGVTSFRVDGERLDGRRQTAVELLEPPDPRLAGCVARRLRPGFADGDTILKKERVAAYRAPSSRAGEPPAGCGEPQLEDDSTGEER